MSQAADLAAIHEMFSRTKAKNSIATGIKASFQSWYSGLGPIDKNFSTAILVEAKNRRDAFNRANASALAAPTSANAPAALAMNVIPPGNYPDIRLSTRKTNDKNAVKLVQRFLKANPVDGDFGPQTESLVRGYQKTHKDIDGKPLKADGWVGGKTWGAMIRDSAAVMTTQTSVPIAVAQAVAAVSRPPTPPPVPSTVAQTAAAVVSNKPAAAAKPAPKPKPKAKENPVQVAAKKAVANVTAAASAPVVRTGAFAPELAAMQVQLTQAANEFRTLPRWVQLGSLAIGALGAFLGLKAVAKVI